MTIAGPPNDISELPEKFKVCKVLITWASSKAYSFK